MTSFLSFDPWADLAQIPAAKPAATASTEREGKATFAAFAAFASLHSETHFFTPDSAGEDWREDYEERVAIAMIDGEQAEDEARRIAFKSCVIRWLDLHPVISSPDHCVGCGKPDQPGKIVPFGSVPPGHAWLHPGCWHQWSAARRAEAVTALAAMGVAGGEENECGV